MCLPAPKVPNVPGVANQRWPARLYGPHRVVNLDRKEDDRTMLAFSCQGGFYFLLDPLACNRALGQDQQELVIDVDRLINAGAEAVRRFSDLPGQTSSARPYFGDPHRGVRQWRGPYSHS